MRIGLIFVQHCRSISPMYSMNLVATSFLVFKKYAFTCLEKSSIKQHEWDPPRVLDLMGTITSEWTNYSGCVVLVIDSLSIVATVIFPWRHPLHKSPSLSEILGKTSVDCCDFFVYCVDWMACSVMPQVPLVLSYLVFSHHNTLMFHVECVHITLALHCHYHITASVNVVFIST